MSWENNMPLLEPSERELEVLTVYARFRSVRLTANALCISTHTVDAHLDHMRSRAGLRTRDEFLALAIEMGWLCAGAAAK